MDALSGVVYADDRQIFSLKIVKRYAANDCGPHTSIMLKTANGKDEP